MGENLFCPGQSVASQAYRDGITRLDGYPEMNEDVKKMLYGFSLEQAFMFFVGKMEFDPEYAGFLTREIQRGWL